MSAEMMATIQQNLQSEVLGVILIGVIMLLSICAVIFLAFRRTRLWYWKVNEQLVLLQNIDVKLDRIHAGVIRKEKPSVEGQAPQENESTSENADLEASKEETEEAKTEVQQSDITEAEAISTEEAEKTVCEKEKKIKPGYNVGKTGKIYEEDVLRNQIQF